MNCVKLKGKSIREAEEEIQDSCTWKAILGLRDRVRKHIIHQIGNGKCTSVWHDIWNSMGQLSQFIGYRYMYDARLQNSNTVADMIEEDHWKWPDNWSVMFPNIFNLNVACLIQDKSDECKWRTNCGKEEGFSIKKVWEDMREKRDKVDWWKVVWSSQCFPRHAFVLWIVVMGRLVTQDRIGKWNT